MEPLDESWQPQPFYVPQTMSYPPVSLVYNPVDGITYPVPYGQPMYFGPPMGTPRSYEDMSTVSSGGGPMALQEELASTSTQLRAATKALHERDTELEKVIGERNAAQTSVATLTAERDTAAANLATATATMATLTAERDTAAANLATATATMATLTTQRDTARVDLNAVTAERDAASSKLATITKERDGLQASAAASRTSTNNRAKDDRIASMERTIRHLKKQLKTLQDVLNTANKRYKQAKTASDNNARMLHAKVASESALRAEFEEKITAMKASIKNTAPFKELEKRAEKQRKQLVKALEDKAQEVAANQELRAFNASMSEGVEARDKRLRAAEMKMAAMRAEFKVQLTQCKKIAADVYAAKNKQLQAEVGRLMLELQEKSARLRTANDDRQRLVSSTRNPLTDAFVFNVRGVYEEDKLDMPVVTGETLDELSTIEDEPTLERTVAMLRVLADTVQDSTLPMAADKVAVASVMQRLSLAELALFSNTRPLPPQHTLASMAHQATVAMCMQSAAEAASASTDTRVLAERLSTLLVKLRAMDMLPLDTAEKVAKARLVFDDKGRPAVMQDARSDREATNDISHMRSVVQHMFVERMGSMPPSLMALVNLVFMSSELMTRTLMNKMTNTISPMKTMYTLRNFGLHTLVLFFINRLYAPFGKMSLPFLRSAVQLVLAQDQGDTFIVDYMLWHQLLAISTVVGMSNLDDIMACKPEEAEELKTKFLPLLKETWAANNLNHTITGDAMALLLMLLQMSGNMRVAPMDEAVTMRFSKEFFWRHIMAHAEKLPRLATAETYTVNFTDDTMMNREFFTPIMSASSGDGFGVRFDMTDEHRKTSNAAIRLAQSLFHNTHELIQRMAHGGKVVLGKAGQAMGIMGDEALSAMLADPVMMERVIEELIGSGDSKQRNYGFELRAHLTRMQRKGKK